MEAAVCLHTLTDRAEKEKRYIEALELSQACLNLGREIQAGPVIILALISRGRLLCKNNQFKEAIITLQDALITSSTSQSLPAAQAAQVRYTACHLMGTALWRDGQLDAAARAIEQTVELARLRFGSGSPEIFESLFDRALLALEAKETERSIIQRINECIKEYQTNRGKTYGSPRTSTDTILNEPTQKIENVLATKALELGTALYHHCIWDAASYVLDWGARIADCPTQRTEALLTLAHIASYKSDPQAVLYYVDEAERLWMDVAPRPHLERHIANLRAMAALAEGCEETYRHHLARAQERGESEELSVEERIQLHFTRAQAYRHDGLEDLARAEIADADRLIRRSLVCPLARFNTYLEQGFCAYSDGRFEDSNRLINDALLIASHDLHGNKLLVARARWLKAQNNYAIFTCSEPDSPCARELLLESKRDGDVALQTLADGDLDPHCQIVLLRLLGGVASHLNLPSEEVRYDRELELLEDKHLPPSG